MEYIFVDYWVLSVEFKPERSFLVFVLQMFVKKVRPLIKKCYLKITRPSYEMVNNSSMCNNNVLDSLWYNENFNYVFQGINWVIFVFMLPHGSIGVSICKGNMHILICFKTRRNPIDLWLFVATVGLSSCFFLASYATLCCFPHKYETDKRLEMKHTE